MVLNLTAEQIVKAARLTLQLIESILKMSTGKWKMICKCLSTWVYMLRSSPAPPFSSPALQIPEVLLSKGRLYYIVCKMLSLNLFLLWKITTSGRSQYDQQKNIFNLISY